MAVSSVQLSATTTTLSGGLVCPHSDRSVAAIVSASLCAGTRTVSRSGVAATSSLSGNLVAGSSGSSARRSAAGPSGVRITLRNLRSSGESGGGIRLSRARTRIAAATWSAASPRNTAARAAPAASRIDNAGNFHPSREEDGRRCPYAARPRHPRRPARAAPR